MRGKAKVIVNEGIDIDLPRLNLSSNYNKNIFLSGFTSKTAMTDNSREKDEWQLAIINVATGKAISCHFRDKIMLGRGSYKSSNHFILKVTTTNTVGREQCIISICEGIAYIEDCHSVNGTSANGKRVDKKMRLPKECRLGLADEEYRLSISKN